MAFWVQVSPGSSEPIYAQIVAQVARVIAAGQITVGDKLPTVRRLAGELVINPNTVARAYAILEQQGLVTTKTGSGTFVADPKLRDTDAAQINILTERMDNIIAQGINLGLNPAEVIGMMKTRLRQFSAKTPSKGRRK
jgi:GntR family transcriptional regulator